MMIEQTVETMLELIDKMKESIKLDIEDIKQARHEKLLDRNSEKEEMINEISSLKIELNKLIVEKMKAGEDVNIYRQKVDYLEEELRSLYKLNKELASIVLPVQQMYKEIVEDLTKNNGGALLDVKA
jgi:DNA repair ATPase RecN